MIKKPISFLILIFILTLIINFARNSFYFISRDESIKKAEEDLKVIEEENLKLKKKLDYYKSDVFIEKEIRDKLQMAKPGEEIIILPEELTIEASGSESFGVKVTGANIERLPNWQKWLELF